jgi:hypothetical protein
MKSSRVRYPAQPKKFFLYKNILNALAYFVPPSSTEKKFCNTDGRQTMETVFNGAFTLTIVIAKTHATSTVAVLTLAPWTTQ